MAVTNYTTLNGVVVHEDRGGTQRNYVPDTLGSTAKMTDATAVTDTFEYWPYGEQRSHTGTNATSFTYCGTLGYCQVGSGSAMAYVRARMYMASRGRWATVDQFWPVFQAYEYVSGGPNTYVDPSGKRRKIQCTPYWKKRIDDYCRHCELGRFDLGCYRNCQEMRDLYRRACPPLPPPGVGRSTNACQWIALNWDKRFDENGLPGLAWATECCQCCDFAYYEATPFWTNIVTAVSPTCEYVTACCADCMDGKFTGGGGGTGKTAYDWLMDQLK